MNRRTDYTPLIATLQKSHGPVSGPVLADLSGLPRRTAQRWLTTLERSGVVERQGVKGGWLLRKFEYSNVAHLSAQVCYSASPSNR